MKKKRYIGRMILLVCVALFVGVQFYSWNAKQFAGNLMPMPFGIGTGVVLSGSMEGDAPDALSVNDIVFVRKTDNFAVGDVVVYQERDILVVHRVISITEDGDTITTKGDANDIADEPVKRSDVKGVVIGHIPALGKVVDIIQQPVSIMLLLTVSALLAILSYRLEQKQDTDELNKLREEIEKLKGEK